MFCICDRDHTIREITTVTMCCPDEHFLLPTDARTRQSPPAHLDQQQNVRLELARTDYRFIAASSRCSIIDLAHYQIQLPSTDSAEPTYVSALITFKPYPRWADGETTIIVDRLCDRHRRSSSSVLVRVWRRGELGADSTSVPKSWLLSGRPVCSLNGRIVCPEDNNAGELPGA